MKVKQDYKTNLYLWYLWGKLEKKSANPSMLDVSINIKYFVIFFYYLILPFHKYLN